MDRDISTDDFQFNVSLELLQNMAMNSGSQNLLMTGQYLEDLLLRPQATEVSYSFLEQLVITRIDSKIIGSVPGKDSLVELLNVFTKMLGRAGSGWIILKSRRISRKVLVGTMRCITQIDADSDAVLGALNNLVGCSSVLLRCSQEEIIAEVMRLLKVNLMPSVNMWRLVRSLLIVCEPRLVDRQTILSSDLANLAICRTGYEAASCMEVLSILIQSIRANSQMLNTSLGLSRRAASVFSGDQEVVRLFRELLDKSKTASSQDHQTIPEPIVKLVEEAEDVVPVVTPIEVPQSSIEDRVDESSPRSSCPSLDL